MKQPASTTASTTATGRGSFPLWQPDRWPGPVQRLMLAGGVLGSAIGLVVGLLTGDRSLPGVLLVYLLGFLCGLVVGAAAGLALHGWQAARRSDRPPPARAQGK